MTINSQLIYLIINFHLYIIFSFLSISFKRHCLLWYTLLDRQCIMSYHIFSRKKKIFAALTSSSFVVSVKKRLICLKYNDPAKMDYKHSIYLTILFLLDDLFLSVGCAGVVVSQPMDTVKVNTAVMIFRGSEMVHFIKSVQVCQEWVRWCSL